MMIVSTAVHPDRAWLLRARRI